MIHDPDPSGRSKRRYLRYVTRNECLNALYNEPLAAAHVAVSRAARALLSYAARVEYRRSVGLGVDRPGTGGEPGSVRGIPAGLAGDRQTWKRLRTARPSGTSRLSLSLLEGRVEPLKRLLTVGHSYVIAAIAGSRTRWRCRDADDGT